MLGLGVGAAAANSSASERYQGQIFIRLELSAACERLLGARGAGSCAVVAFLRRISFLLQVAIEVQN